MQWNEFRSHIRHLPAAELSRIERAFELGKHMHGNQKRKSGEPYFQHPIAVAHMLADLGADPDTLVAALLHDTVEDTPLTLEEIDAQFDGSVKALIDGVTKLSSKDVAMSPKLDEQKETLRKIFTLMERDVRIMVIKLIDRLHNMQTIEFLSPERQQLLATETLEVFVKIADKLCMQDLRDELEILCLSVLEPALYSPLVELRNANEQRGIAVIDSMRAQLATHNRLLTARTDMVYENKSWGQLKAQINAGNTIATGVTFVTAVFVCENLDSCYQMLGALHQVWKREILSFQDFINTPQLNGYRGLHTTIIAQDGTRVRCKIRTKEMHEYARKGVASVCFTKTSNIEEILPWTKHLSPLAADTQGSSNDFWQNLQSDILGQSITIHGPNDNTVQLPSGATALDAAFYLFQDLALRTESIRVNGADTTFNTQVQNADTVEIVMAHHNTCTREWLRWVQTGLAAAKIRSVLVHQSEDKKLDTGRQMLQQVFSQRKRGFIEEFSEATLHNRLAALGYDSMKAIYIAIADGRLEPAHVFNSLFEMPRSAPHAQVPVTDVSYIVTEGDIDMMDRMNMVHRTYGSDLEDIHYRRMPQETTVTLKVRMDTRTLDIFTHALQAAGAKKLSSNETTTLRTVLIVVLLVLLWGIDPVLSKIILHSGVDAFAFTFIRAWSVFLFAFAFLLKERGSRSLVRIPFDQPWLWMAGISLFFVSVLTYLFLEDGSPLLYNTVLRANAVVIAAPLLFRSQSVRSMLLTFGFAIAGFAFVLAGPFSLYDVLFAVVTLFVFYLYTIATGRFQSAARIQARYVQLFASTTFIAALCSLSLLFAGYVHFPTTGMLLLTAVYAICFVGLPYIIFHGITDNVGYATLSPWINATLWVTLLGQIFILNDFVGFAFLVPAGLLLTGASLLASKTKRLADNH